MSKSRAEAKVLPPQPGDAREAGRNRRMGARAPTPRFVVLTRRSRCLASEPIPCPRAAGPQARTHECGFSSRSRGSPDHVCMRACVRARERSGRHTAPKTAAAPIALHALPIRPACASRSGRREARQIRFQQRQRPTALRSPVRAACVRASRRWVRPAGSVVYPAPSAIPRWRKAVRISAHHHRPTAAPQPWGHGSRGSLRVREDR